MNKSIDLATTITSLPPQPGKTKGTCPSEIAWPLQPGDWRPLIPHIRVIVAFEIPKKDKSITIQKGNPVDPSYFKGSH